LEEGTKRLITLRLPTETVDFEETHIPMVQQLISRRYRGPPVLWISCVRDLFELVSRNAFNGRLGGLSCKYIPDAKRALYAGEHIKVASEGFAVPDSPWARGRRLAVAMLDSQHRLKDSTS